MKCWECKHEISRARRVSYVAMDCHSEPYDSKTRDVGYCCLPQIQMAMDKLHRVQVSKLSQTKLRGGVK